MWEGGCGKWGATFQRGGQKSPGKGPSFYHLLSTLLLPGPPASRPSLDPCPQHTQDLSAGGLFYFFVHLGPLSTRCHPHWKVCLLLGRVRLCDPTDYSLPGSSVHRIFQARTLEWVAISFSWGSSRSRDQTWIAGGFFTHRATRGAPVIPTSLYIARQAIHDLYQCWVLNICLLNDQPRLDCGSQ